MIEDLIEKAGLTKRKFASECGIAEKALYEILSGKRMPRFTTMKAMAKALGLKTLGELVTECSKRNVAYNEMKKRRTKNVTRK